jgi:hypothetical protein
VQQQDQLAVAQGNIALNLIEVYRAVGGGWELRLQNDARNHDLVANGMDADSCNERDRSLELESSKALPPKELPLLEEALPQPR